MVYYYVFMCPRTNNVKIEFYGPASIIFILKKKINMLALFIYFIIAIENEISFSE